VSYEVSYAICQVLPPTQVLAAVLFTIAPCNAAGQWATSAPTVTAVSVDGTAKPVSALPDPSNAFLFIPFVNVDTYLLSVSKLAAGSHTLQVTVAGDPVTHSIAFSVKQ
jgi:hypothetical protein